MGGDKEDHLSVFADCRLRGKRQKTIGNRPSSLAKILRHVGKFGRHIGKLAVCIGNEDISLFAAFSLSANRRSTGIPRHADNRTDTGIRLYFFLRGRAEVARQARNLGLTFSENVVV